jgi:prevent-host-death family protein
MKKAKIGELRNNLSRYLDRVRAGETITVFDRNEPIAQIVQLRDRPRTSDEDRLASLERRGLVRRGRGDPRKWFREHKPIEIPGESLSQAVIEDRERGW